MLSVSRETETCIIELLNDPINFRIIIIKSYLKKSNTPIQDPIQDSIQDFIQDSIQDLIQDLIQDPVQSEDITLRRNPPRPRQRPTRFQNNMIDITVYMSKSTPPPFKFMSPPVNFHASRLKKLNELLEKEVFEIINIKDLSTEARVFGSRFVNQMKNEETEKAFEKSRFVI